MNIEKILYEIKISKRELEAHDASTSFLDEAEYELENSNEYQWHDLRKDKYDLPPIGTVVICYFRYKDTWSFALGCYRYTGWQYFNEILQGDELIAWKKIEPFIY